MLEKPDMTDAPAIELRDEEGAIRSEIVEQVTAAIERNDAPALKAIAGELHEADTGDLIEAPVALAGAAAFVARALDEDWTTLVY